MAGQRAARPRRVRRDRRLPAVLPALADRAQRARVLLAVHAGLAARACSPPTSAFGDAAVAILVGVVVLVARELRLRPRGHPRPRAGGAHHRTGRGVPRSSWCRAACTSATSSPPGSGSSSAPRSSRACGATTGGSSRLARCAARRRCSSPARSTRCSGRARSAIYGIIASWGRWRVHRPRRGDHVRWRSSPFVVLTLLVQPGRHRELHRSSRSPPRSRSTSFGFGLRRLMPHTPFTDFTWRESARGELRNAFYFPQFLVGAWLGVVVALVGLWLRRRERSTLALLGLIAVFPVGYSVFWGIRLSSFYAFLSRAALLPARVRAVLHPDRHRDPGGWRRRRVVAVVLCRRARGGHRAVPRVTPRLQPRDQRVAGAVARRGRRVARRLARVRRRARATFLMHLNPFSRNTPDARRPRAVRDRPPRRDARPDRGAPATVVRTSSSRATPSSPTRSTTRTPTSRRVSMVPLSVVRGREFVGAGARHRDEARAARGRAARRRHASTHGVLAADAPTGPGVRHRVARRRSLGLTGRRRGRAARRPDRGRIRVRVASPDSLDAPFARRHLVQRYSYRTVDGVTEVLNPPRQLVGAPCRRRAVVRESLALPGYEVDLVANS